MLTQIDKQKRRSMLAQEDLRLLADEFLDDTGGDVPRAAEGVVAELKRNNRLFHALMEPLLQLACYRLVSEVFRAQRAVGDIGAPHE
jgi:hypothetical protein